MKPRKAFNIINEVKMISLQDEVVLNHELSDELKSSKILGT